MDKNKIIELLGKSDAVIKFADYCFKLCTEKDKNGNIKNFWATKLSDEVFAKYYKQVALDGLCIDGTHITIQSTGISYDYVAYKNKMLLVYPESRIDVQLVYSGDDFSVSKDSGKVEYQHKISNPFSQKDENIIGGYCVIKNRRGEFFTSLSKEEIDKHRKVAKTDYIWKEWLKEMSLKTIIKKACKTHFSDIFNNIEEIDNQNYDLDNSLDITIQQKQEIEDIKTIEALKIYYDDNKDSLTNREAFHKAITKRKEEIKAGVV